MELDLHLMLTIVEDIGGVHGTPSRYIPDPYGNVKKN